MLRALEELSVIRVLVGRNSPRYASHGVATFPTSKRASCYRGAKRSITSLAM